jgi:hypothetical protein
VSPDPPHNQQVTFLLECIECGAHSDEGRGWRAYLDDESWDVWVYCGECSSREFDPA